MSETHGKVVANIQKQLESAKVWENTSRGNPCDKMLKLLLNKQKKKNMHGDQWLLGSVAILLGLVW